VIWAKVKITLRLSVWARYQI